MTRARVLGVASLAGVALLLLTACGPDAPAPTGTPTGPTSGPSASATPTPEPLVRPALGDLALGADGFAQLPLGQVPTTDPLVAMVTFDAAACDGNGVWNADGSYISTDPDAYGPGTAFTVTAGPGSNGALTRIDLNTFDIPTDAGIRIGSTRAEVVAAYAGATVQPMGLTEVFVIEGQVGLLQIEVASDAEYWAGFRPNGTVVYIHASLPDQGVFSVAASENVLGICFA